MNLEKLALAEKHFLQRYPGGFNHPELQELSKKHKMEKITYCRTKGYCCLWG